MQNRIDWRFAVHLIVPGAEYGWLQPGNESKIDLLGKYEYIDWRDKLIPKPSENELRRVWDDYVRGNGTPEQQEKNKDSTKKAALARLKAKAKNNTDIADLLEIVQTAPFQP